MVPGKDRFLNRGSNSDVIPSLPVSGMPSEIDERVLESIKTILGKVLETEREHLKQNKISQSTAASDSELDDMFDDSDDSANKVHRGVEQKFLEAQRASHWGSVRIFICLGM